MNAQVKTNKSKSIVLRLLIVAFCVYLLFSMGSLVTELGESRAELAETNTQITETNKRIDEKNNTLENSTKEELMEKFARMHGYVRPNEQVFVDVSGN